MAKHPWQQPYHQGTEHQAQQQAGPARRQQLEGDPQRQGAQPQQQRRPVHLAQVLQQLAQAVEGGGLVRQFQPQQVGQLAQGDDHRRAEGEAQHHRVRDEVHQGAEAQHSQQPLEDPSQQRQEQDQGDVVLGGRHCQGADAGIENDGNCRRGAADQVPR